jgi:hypothetical protein
MFMDAAARAGHDALAAKYGRRAVVDHQPRGYVRGYQNFDAEPPRSAMDAAAEAYEARSRRMSEAWRTK